MKGLVIAVVVVVLGYGLVQWMEIFKANTDFAARVDRQIAFVDENSMDRVKQDVVADAKALGIDITTNDVHIAYEDTEQQSVAENLVSKKIGVDFTNKRVTITVDYIQHILGIPSHQTITQTRIRQVQAPRKQVSPEMQQLLDATPQ
jgi:ABC-type molybdate transport system ATPase subunit